MIKDEPFIALFSIVVLPSAKVPFCSAYLLCAFTLGDLFAVCHPYDLTVCENFCA